VTSAEKRRCEKERERNKTDRKETTPTLFGRRSRIFPRRGAVGGARARACRVSADKFSIRGATARILLGARFAYNFYRSSALIARERECNLSALARAELTRSANNEPRSGAFSPTDKPPSKPREL